MKASKASRRIAATCRNTSAPLTILYVGHRVGDKVYSYPVTAMWDTGSTRTVVTPRLANRLALEYVGDCSADTANGIKDVAVFFGVYFRIGEVTFGPRSVDVTEFNSEGVETYVDVLVGMDIISKGILTIEPSEDKHYDFSFELK